MCYNIFNKIFGNSGGLFERSTFRNRNESYWTERSKSYSEQNRAQIENEKRHEWENMILKYAPQKECLNILDVGTGPGFFAIILAQKGIM